MYNVTVHVYVFGSIQHQFSFSEKTTVLQLKEKIFQKLRVPVKYQTLNINNIIMDDGNKLIDYEGINGKVLYLHINAFNDTEISREERLEYLYSFPSRRFSDMLNAGSINKIPFQVDLQHQNFKVLPRKKAKLFDETIVDLFAYANWSNDYIEGKSAISDFIMLLFKYFTWNDLHILKVNFPPAEVRKIIVGLRPLLKTFISQLLDGKKTEDVPRACEQICSEMEPYLAIMQEVRLVESIDAVATIINLTKTHLPAMIYDIVDPSIDDEDFKERIIKGFSNYFRKLFAIILQCCQDGHLGLVSIVRSFIRLFKQNTSEPWILLVEIVVLELFKLRSYVRHLDVPVEEIRPYFVLYEKQAIMETREKPNKTISLPSEEWIVVRSRNRRVRKNPDGQIRDKIKTIKSKLSQTGKMPKRRQVVHSGKYFKFIISLKIKQATA